MVGSIKFEYTPQQNRCFPALYYSISCYKNVYDT